LLAHYSLRCAKSCRACAQSGGLWGFVNLGPGASPPGGWVGSPPRRAHRTRRAPVRRWWRFPSV
jgi:hypothetical protein